MLPLLVASALVWQEGSDLYSYTLFRRQPTYHLVGDLRIFLGRTGKVLGTHNLVPYAFSRWSPSGRSLATFDSGWNLVFWNEKEGFWSHRLKPSWEGGELPWYEENPVWSPDERRVMLRIPGNQGAMTLGTGCLLVVDIGSGKTWELSLSAASAKWRNSSTVEFEEKTFFELPQKPLIEKKVWRVPKQRKSRED